MLTTSANAPFPMSLSVGLVGLALCAPACMGDGACRVYDYDPPSVVVTFADADTGTPICDARTAAKPGVLRAVPGACAYLLAGWYAHVDGGVSTSVELTVQGYLPVKAELPVNEDACGTVVAPAPQHFDVKVDPDAD